MGPVISQEWKKVHMRVMSYQDEGSGGTLECNIADDVFSGHGRVEVPGLIYGTNVEKVGRFSCQCVLDGVEHDAVEFNAPGGGYLNLHGVDERQIGYRRVWGSRGVVGVEPVYQQVDEGFEVDLDSWYDVFRYRDVIRSYQLNIQDKRLLGPIKP